MNLYEKFSQNFPVNLQDFEVSLIPYKPHLFVGMTKQNAAAMAIESSQPEVAGRILKTQSLSLEINQKVELTENDQSRETIVNLISCKFNNPKELRVFWDVCEIFANDENFRTVTWIISIFQTLQDFFSTREVPKDIELQGIYTELYTILKFKEYINLGNNWHTDEKMKFDFSLSDLFKLEVKSTIGEVRKHHFKHNQLYANQLEILVLSYLLRRDDQGLSLFSLIEDSYSCLSNNQKQLTRLQKIMFDVDREILESIKFAEPHISQELKIFKAKDIPQFSESSPSGVANAEYDCYLNGAPELPIADFCQLLLELG